MAKACWTCAAYGSSEGPVRHADERLGVISAHDLWRVRAIEALLAEQGTFQAQALPGGLFAAAGAPQEALAGMRYHYVWVRDNALLGHWLTETGRSEQALQVLRQLCTFFVRHRRRFVDIIEGRADPAIAMNRPHVRFEGQSLSELQEPWGHKQNDALGYFLWFACKMLRSIPDRAWPELLPTLALFPRFFHSVRFWQDDDSGHWEEEEAVHASSIGVALAGLLALRHLQDQAEPRRVLAENGASCDLVEELCEAGRRALAAILPNESIDSQACRTADAALLFLIYPLDVVDDESALRIIRRVRDELQGEIGVARYRGDTFWAPDYKERVSAAQRTGFVAAADERLRIDVPSGQEAQWCLFDSTLSTIHGQRFLRHGHDEDLERQVEYLNRALAQLTKAADGFTPFRCPEAYYLARGHWTPNDATPLLWAQADLQLSLRQAARSADRIRSNRAG